MSRFSPDTWIDAIQLPFAMAQFKGNIYVESISPDLRPSAFIILTVTAMVVAIFKIRQKKQAEEYLTPALNRRSALALIAATFISMTIWIITSSNGRYGITAITLSPLAAIAALLLATRSPRIVLITIGVLLMLQSILLLTADPDEPWLKLTQYKWKERHADLLPTEVVQPWRNSAENRITTVVTTKSLTGMSTLYQVFGKKAHYIGLSYLDQFSMHTSEHKRAIEMIRDSEAVYLSNAIAAPENLKDVVRKNQIATSRNEKLRLLRFGLLLDDNASCTLLPARMGTQLQICPLTKISPDTNEPNSKLPQQPLLVLKALGEKCPGILDEAMPARHDGDGGISTSTHDEKYSVEIKSNLDIFIRHRREHANRLLISGKEIEKLESITCNKLIDAGHQYW